MCRNSVKLVNLYFSTEQSPTYQLSLIQYIWYDEVKHDHGFYSSTPRDLHCQTGRVNNGGPVIDPNAWTESTEKGMTCGPRRWSFISDYLLYIHSFSYWILVCINISKTLLTCWSMGSRLTISYVYLHLCWSLLFRYSVSCVSFFGV